MLKIVNTKYRSEKQMESMARNLREKFKLYCSVSYTIDFDAHEARLYNMNETARIDIKETYKFYINPNHQYAETWKGCLQLYYKLMGQ